MSFSDSKVCFFQVYTVFNTYGAPHGLKVGLTIGKKLFDKDQEQLVGEDFNGYYSLIDILVATPGKLTDHISHTPGFDLSHLR